MLGWSRVFMILTSRKSFWSDPGLSWVLSIILMVTSLPVGMCLASLTLAKFPFPIVLSNLYFPMWGSSPPARLDEILADELPSLP